MKKLKITLFVSLPLFGIFSVIIPGVLDFHHPYTFYLNLIPNIIAIIPIEMILEYDKTSRNFDFEYYDELSYTMILISNLVFWLPIAYYINKFLDDRKTKHEYSGQNTNEF